MVGIVVGALLVAGAAPVGGTLGGLSPAVGQTANAPRDDLRLAELVRRERADVEPIPFATDDPDGVARVTVGRGREASTLSVTPDTGLVHGQELVIHGEGWRPGDEIVALQCVDGQPWRGCEILTPYDDALASGYPRVGPQGRFTLREPAEVVIDLPEGPLDCRVETCLVAVGSLFASSVRSVEVGFDPGGPDPTRSTASATPDSGLVDGDEVTVTGEGFPQDIPGFGVGEVTPCRVPVTSWDDCDRGELQYVDVARSGHLEGVVNVTPILHVASGDTDCRAAACALVVQSVDFETFDGLGELSEAAVVPVAFDPGGAIRPPPTLTITPSTGLHDGDAVHVHGAGFDPGRGFDLFQCRAGATSSADCEGDVGYFGWSDDGTIDGWVSLRARFPDGDGDRVDCRVEACSYVIAHGDLGRHAEAATAFDPEGDLLDPEIVVTPTSGLTDGDRLTVTGTGWPTGEHIEIAQCPAGAFDLFECDDTTAVSVVTESSGTGRVPLPRSEAEAEAVATPGSTISATLTVRSRLTFENVLPRPSDYDCTTEPCIVMASDWAGLRAARVRISFGDAVGPISATPTFTG
jgi:hypothetical protein